MRGREAELRSSRKRRFSSLSIGRRSAIGAAVKRATKASIAA
jgi:hypothetical protein